MSDETTCPAPDMSDAVKVVQLCIVAMEECLSEAQEWRNDWSDFDGRTLLGSTRANVTLPLGMAHAFVAAVSTTAAQPTPSPVAGELTDRQRLLKAEESLRSARRDATELLDGAYRLALPARERAAGPLLRPRGRTMHPMRTSARGPRGRGDDPGSQP